MSTEEERVDRNIQEIHNKIDQCKLDISTTNISMHKYYEKLGEENNDFIKR